jgi:Flp pilus assembly protein TadD
VAVAGWAAGRGPAAAVFADVGTRARGAYFEAAITMWQDRPVLGVGLDHYGKFWRTARSPQSLEVLGGTDYSDAAHSVPLQMLAQGGLVLGLAYVVFVAVTAVVLVRGLVTLRGADRMLLASVGAGWAAYQVQSWVSIDQVPLIVLHFTLAAAVAASPGRPGTGVAAAGGPPAGTGAGPGTSEPPSLTAPPGAAQPGRLRHRRARRRRSHGVAALYLVLAPVRADMAVRNGDAALAVGDGDASLAAYDTAVSLVPGQSMYWRKKADLLIRATPPQTEAALAAFREAVAADPYDVRRGQGLARLTELTGDIDSSRELYRRAVALEPYNDEVVAGAAVFALRSGDPAAAAAMLEAASQRCRTLPRCGTGSVMLAARSGTGRRRARPTSGRSALPRTCRRRSRRSSCSSPDRRRPYEQLDGAGRRA